MRSSFILILLVAYFQYTKCDRYFEYETRLLNDQLQDYDKRVRPVENKTHPLMVTVQATMKKLHDVDEARGEITTVMWLKLSWFDEHFSWDLLDAGVAAIRMPSSAVWKPDIAVLNCIRDCTIRPHDEVMVENDGLVSLLASVTVTSPCHLYYGWFPFDKQDCPLVWGSLSYDKSEVDLEVDEIFTKLDEFRWDVKWEVTDVKIDKRLDKVIDDRRANIIDEKTVKNTSDIKINNTSDKINITSDDKPVSNTRELLFPKIIMRIQFSRLTRPYIMGFLWPCFLFCGIILLQFFLSADSSERIILSVSTILMIVVYGLFMTGMGSAPWQAVSVLGAYFICISLAAAAALAITIFVINLHHKRYSERRMKDKAQKYFLHWIPKLLFMDPLPENKWRRKSIFGASSRQVSRQSQSAGGAEQVPLLDLTAERTARQQSAPTGTNLGDQNGTDEVRRVTEEFKVAYAWMELIRMVKEIIFRIDRQLADDRSEEWKFTAEVMNRAGFLLITLYMFLVHLALLILVLTA